MDIEGAVVRSDVADDRNSFGVGSKPDRDVTLFFLNHAVWTKQFWIDANYISLAENRLDLFSLYNLHRNFVDAPTFAYKNIKRFANFQRKCANEIDRGQYVL